MEELFDFGGADEKGVDALDGPGDTLLHSADVSEGLAC